MASIRGWRELLGRILLMALGLFTLTPTLSLRELTGVGIVCFQVSGW